MVGTNSNKRETLRVIIRGVELCALRLSLCQVSMHLTLEKSLDLLFHS